MNTSLVKLLEGEDKSDKKLVEMRSYVKTQIETAKEKLSKISRGISLNDMKTLSKQSTMLSKFNSY